MAEIAYFIEEGTRRYYCRQNDLATVDDNNAYGTPTRNNRRHINCQVSSAAEGYTYTNLETT